MKKNMLFGYILLIATLNAQNLDISGEKSFEWKNGEFVDSLRVQENSNVKITGEINGITARDFQVGENANLDIKFKSDKLVNSGLNIYFKNKHKEAFTLLGKGSTLNIESYATGELDSFRSPYGYGYGFGWLEDKYISRGLFLSADGYSEDMEQNLNIAGNLNIKSSAFGLDTFTNWYENNSSKEESTHNEKNRWWDSKKIINFLSTSKTDIKATFTGVFLGGNGDTLRFMEGSQAKIAGGNFGVNVNSGGHQGEGNIQMDKNSKLQIEGDIALQLREGSLILEPNVPDEAAPELKVFGRKKAITGVKFKTTDGSPTAKLKLIAKGHDAFERTSGDLTLVKGSKIDGSIWESPNFNLTLEKGTKLFTDEELALKNLNVKGDFFVGSEESYIDGYAGASHMTDRVSKLSKKEISDILKVATMTDEQIEKSSDMELKKAKEVLNELDGVSGASYILMDKMKKKSLETAKEIEFINFARNFEGKPELKELFKNAAIDTYYGDVSLEKAKEILKEKFGITEQELVGVDVVEANKILRNDFGFPAKKLADISIADTKKMLKEKFGVSDKFLADIKGQTEFWNIYKAIHQHNPKEYCKLTLSEGTFNFDDATIHLRAGGEKKLSETTEKSNNDILKIGEKAIIKANTKIKIHPSKEDGISRKTKFDLIEEDEKEISGKKGYNLETAKLSLKDTDMGPLVFTRKDRVENKRYIVSLVATDRLSESARKSLNYARDTYFINKIDLEKINKEIFRKRDFSKKNNLWLTSTSEKYTNKETGIRKNTRSNYAGYDYSFGPKLAVGFFAGKTNGYIDNTSQGIYLTKDYKNAYLGILAKRAYIKKGSRKKVFAKDIAIALGYNWDSKERLMLDTSVILNRGSLSGEKYKETNGMNTRREKYNYLDGSLNLKLSYKLNNGKIYLDSSVGKNLWGKEKIVWNEDVEREIKNEGFLTTIGVGGEYQINNHTVDLKIFKRSSKYNKSNLGVRLGYNLKF